MWICYIDEAGCTGVLPSNTSEIQPILTIGGILVDQTRIRDLTTDFLNLKKQFFPHAKLPNGNQPQNSMDWALFEVKGAEIRRMVSESSNRRHSAVTFLEKLIEIMKKHQIRIIGRLLVKGIGHPINGIAFYTASLQKLCQNFQHYLGTVHGYGFIIADSRNKEQNAVVSHSIFTQKYRYGGDDYSRILEMPTFGHSENHAGIQICDLLCSALLFPMAIDAFCVGHLTSCHVRGNTYQVLREKFGGPISQLQHRYQNSEKGYWCGGISTTNSLSTTLPKFLLRVT